MEDKRTYLVGCILQGMAASGEVYFGMAEDALAIADATIAQMKQGNETEDLPSETNL